MVSKYVLILVIVVAAIFIWRSNRKIAVKERKAKEEKSRVIDMTACRWCSVHVPALEALQGKHGSYCSAAHLRKAEP